MKAYITMDVVNGMCHIYGYMASNGALIAAGRDGIRSVAERSVRSRLMELGFDEVEDRTGGPK